MRRFRAKREAFRAARYPVAPWTFERLGSVTGRTKGHWNNVEKGKATVSEAEARTVAEAMGVDLDAIFEPVDRDA